MTLKVQVSSSVLLALLVTLVVQVCVPFHPVSAQQGIVNHSTEKDSDDSELMVIEDLEEEEGSAMEERDIFVATNEWQVVKEGQSIPPGLYVRMNLQTGLKEAKLLDEADKNGGDSKDVEPSTTDDITGDGEVASPESDSVGAKFTGDNRRTHYLGKSDRRGIVNKKTKVFTRKELMEALNREEEEEEEGSERMLLTAQELNDNNPNMRTTARDISDESTHLSADGEPIIRRQAELPYTLHEEVETMLDHSRTLAKKEATVTELVHALEELEYHVHNIDNAKDFDVIGGLVLVIRQLNHSSPEVRSHAAHVIGAASQSNPLLQQQVYDYGGLDHLCTLISNSEPDLVQRRSLYALSALLRGNVQYQSIFLERCRGLEVLGGSFHDRGAQVQLKAVTLLTDIINEQEEAEVAKGERKNILPILHDHILKHGWCGHASSPIHSEEGTRIEKGLQAMNALQRTCDFSGQVGRLRRLTKQFERTLEQEKTDTHEYTELLLDYSRTLLRTIRQQNLDL